MWEMAKAELPCQQNLGPLQPLLRPADCAAQLFLQNVVKVPQPYRVRVSSGE